MDTEKLKLGIRAVNDYPKKGIVFRDITTLIKDPDSFASVVDEMASRAPKGINAVVGIEARGFIFASALAYKLGAGMVPIRKKGKLPAERISESYDLEYGSETVEIHSDAIKGGDRVLIVDDLLATGGTASAARSLIERLGGEVSAFVFVIELKSLRGRDRLGNTPIISLLEY